MSPKIQFENHFNARVIEILFPDGYSIKTQSDIQNLKKQWQNNLKSWHTPYTCVFDMRKFDIDDSLLTDFQKLIEFFKKFHMKKIIGFKDEFSNTSTAFSSFEIFSNYDNAISQTGLTKGAGLTRNTDNLREKIVIENDFQAHVMEISFLTDTVLNSKADVQILKSKIQNILRMWHTPYHVLFNCVNLKFSDDAKKAFPALALFLKGFFCEEIIGYSPCEAKERYPFDTYRSRHIAAGKLNHLLAQSGNSANCSK